MILVAKKIQKFVFNFEVGKYIALDIDNFGNEIYTSTNDYKKQIYMNIYFYILYLYV